MHQAIQALINNYQEILDKDPLDQMEDTQTILTRFTDVENLMVLSSNSK